MRKEYSRIPFPMIVRACDGDTEAINQILHHYRGYGFVSISWTQKFELT